MGKRSRKKHGPAARPDDERLPIVLDERDRPHARPLDHRARLDEAPKAPWAPFPLVELCILLGMVCILLGFFGVGDKRGWLLGAGFTLVSLSALELAVREHVAGYRSHSALLAGVVAIVVVTPLFFATGWPQEALLILGAAVFSAAFQGLRTVFSRKTGGLGFRV